VNFFIRDNFLFVIMFQETNRQQATPQETASPEISPKVTRPQEISPQEKNRQNSSQLESNKSNTFGVAPSPFNGIKLELGIVIVVAALLLIGVDSITQDTLIQIGVLFLAGASAMVWIIWRTRRIIKRLK
jgi:hypothetical protein